VTDALVLHGPEGSITVPPEALEQLVVSAAQSVDGARVRRPRRSVEVLHAKGRATVSLGLVARHGDFVPDLARAVQERVAAAIVRSCGLEVDRVDVTVEEVDG
jgi:uncharacterized alkaline shock family protein YloU